MRWLKLPAHGHSIDLDKIAVVHGGIDEERENRPWCDVTWESGFTVNYQGSDASVILAALEGGAPGNPARRAWHDLTTCGECRAAYHQGQDDLTAEPIRALAAAREEIAALRAKLDAADCTQREGGDTRHCAIHDGSKGCWRCRAERAEAERDALARAIAWALGEGDNDFQEPPGISGRYWWRRKLMEMRDAARGGGGE